MECTADDELLLVRKSDLEPGGGPSSTNPTRRFPGLLALKMISDLINDF